MKEKEKEIKHLESKYAIDEHFSEMSEEEIWGKETKNKENEIKRK